jgi:hypothetical protein
MKSNLNNLKFVIILQLQNFVPALDLQSVWGIFEQYFSLSFNQDMKLSEAESKEKHGVWDPMPELITTSTPESTPTQPYARVDFIPRQAETLDLASADLSIFRGIQEGVDKRMLQNVVFINGSIGVTNSMLNLQEYLSLSVN